jgi:hypothetical protein
MWNVWNVTAGHWVLRRDVTEEEAKMLAQHYNGETHNRDYYEARERNSTETIE